MSGSADWRWHAPLDGTADVETTGDADVDLQLANEHDFERLAGSQAWVPKDPRATIRVPFDGWSDRRAGTISAWVSPLEDVASWMNLSTNVEGENGHARLPVVSDAYRRANLGDATLALTVYPGPRVGLQGRTTATAGGYLAEYASADRPRLEPTDPEGLVTQATLYQHTFPMEPGHWYHVALAWDADEGRIDMYANGEHINEGRNRGMHLPDEALFFGNSIMGLADLRASDERLPPAAIEDTFERELEGHDRPLDDGTARAIHGERYDPTAIDRDVYEEARAYDLTDPAVVDSLVQHGPDESVLPERRATSDGLLFETPDGWDYQDCATLWFPGNFEGDQIVEWEAKIERPEGLALLIFDASTFERGDIIDDRNYEVTGNMGPIISDIRSYWWEFFRRTPPTRRDPDSHILLKGAYGYPPLDENIADLPETDTWHTYTFRKEGDVIEGAIDGQPIVRADESNFPANGPSLNMGRIGIRHMQQTRIRYRNLMVHTRTPDYRE